MPTLGRIKTKYPGVYYVMANSLRRGKTERIYYVRYRKDGKEIEEKAGRQFRDDMTPSRASQIRVQRIQGSQLSNREKRKARRTQRETEVSKWTIERLWKEYKARSPGLRGIGPDENRFQKYIKPNFGNKEPRELSPLDIDRVRINLLKAKTPGTVKNVLEVLRRIINFGVEKRLCQGIDFTIGMPRINNLKTEDLSPEQLVRLLEAIEQDTNIQAANLMKMALFTGMRRGELFKLNWEDVDFQRGFISIRDPKGGPDQKIPLNDGARRILETHPRTDSAFVFPGRDGNQRTDIKKQVNRIKEKAGLPKGFRALHGLRHVYASTLASSGKVDMYTLQRLLTHKSPIMTQRYAHLRDEALKRAANLAGDLFEQASNGKKPGKVVHLEKSTQ